MARHIARPDPRAHWLLLLLGLLALLAALSFNGLVTNVGGGSGPSDAPASPAPRQATTGGPVLRLDGPTPVARRMPAADHRAHLRRRAGPALDAADPRRARAGTTRTRRSSWSAPGSTSTRSWSGGSSPRGTRSASHTFTHADLAAVPAGGARLELALTRNAIAGATGRRADAAPAAVLVDRRRADRAASTQALRDAARHGLPRRAHRPGHQGLAAARRADAIVAAASPPARRRARW